MLWFFLLAYTPFVLTAAFWTTDEWWSSIRSVLCVWAPLGCWDNTADCHWALQIIIKTKYTSLCVSLPAREIQQRIHGTPQLSRRSQTRHYASCSPCFLLAVEMAQSWGVWLGLYSHCCRVHIPASCSWTGKPLTHHTQGRATKHRAVLMYVTSFAIYFSVINWKLVKLSYISSILSGLFGASSSDTETLGTRYTVQYTKLHRLCPLVVQHNLHGHIWAFFLLLVNRWKYTWKVFPSLYLFYIVILGLP